MTARTSRVCFLFLVFFFSDSLVPGVLSFLSFFFFYLHSRKSRGHEDTLGERYRGSARVCGRRATPEAVRRARARLARHLHCCSLARSLRPAVRLELVGELRTGITPRRGEPVKLPLPFDPASVQLSRPSQKPIRDCVHRIDETLKYHSTKEQRDYLSPRTCFNVVNLFLFICF